ncbi:MAG: universal stress protein [Deltaproteobacteria bacterium]|nr:universal stress protein [Deltaproteobacteria bacterium]
MLNVKFTDYRVTTYEPSGGTKAVSRVAPAGKTTDQFSRSLEEARHKIKEHERHEDQEQQKEQKTFEEQNAAIQSPLQKPEQNSVYVSHLYEQNLNSLLAGEEIPNITVAFDGSLPAYSALDWAMCLADHYRSQLHLVESHQKLSDTQAKLEVQKRQQELEPIFSPHGNSIITHQRKPIITALEKTTPSLGILECARDSNSSLIVMGSHSRKGAKKTLMGSVASDVITQSETPVLVCPKDCKDFEIKNILVPVDNQKFSLPAIQRAIALGHDFHAQVHLFHVPSENKTDDWDPSLFEKINWQGTTHSFDSKAGDITNSILQHAAETNCDLIVMAKHTHKDLFTRSITEEVLENTSCPLWIVYPKSQ